MSKSAPVTPTKAFKKANFFESRLKVRFNAKESKYFFGKPSYPEETYPWEDKALYAYNRELANKKNIDPGTESESDSAEPASPKSAFYFPSHSSADVNADHIEQKERSDEEESESFDNSESGESEDEGDYESDEYSEPEREDEYQEPKRFKVTKLPPPPFPDYTYLLADYEALCKKPELQISFTVAVDAAEDTPEEPILSVKRKQPEESQDQDSKIETYQPNLKNYKIKMHNPLPKIPKPTFPDYAPLIEAHL